MTTTRGEISPPTKLALKAGETLVIENGKGKFSQFVSTGGHILTADEPKDAGGGNTGPDPYDFLLTALGACTSMTIRMYADFKNIPLERVGVKLSHAKIHARDCQDCESKTGMIDEIIREIELVGADLTDGQREKMLEIANKCPVHRTLHSEVKVRTNLKN